MHNLSNLVSFEQRDYSCEAYGEQRCEELQIKIKALTLIKVVVCVQELAHDREGHVENRRETQSQNNGDKRMVLGERCSRFEIVEQEG